MKEILRIMQVTFTYKKIQEFISTLMFAFIFAFLFQTILYQPFKIPSSSMSPTLQVGDYLFVEKFAYGYNNNSLTFMLSRLNLLSQTYFFKSPKIGDVIVFASPKEHRSPKDNKDYYIKRLIGLPGDAIQIVAGELYINGVIVKREYEKQVVNVVKGKKYIRDIYQETLPNGITHKIYVSPNTNKMDMPNTTPIYTVPKNHYFFMGDNRDNSIDSRYLNEIGFVPKSKIIGKAQFLFWSSDFSIYNFITKLQTNRALTLIT
jgi:signal peptidase I